MMGKFAFSKLIFRKSLLGIPCRVSNSLDLDQNTHFLGGGGGGGGGGLIWVQTVCKDYQQMIKVAASKKETSK